MKSCVNAVCKWCVLWPQAVAASIAWSGPLLARIVVGYVFLRAGWGKLQHLDGVSVYFAELGVPMASVMAPFVSIWECVGGALLMLGLFARISAGGLAVVMVVAIMTAQWSEVETLVGLFGLEESTYFVVFTWLAVSGAGAASLDHWLERYAILR